MTLTVPLIACFEAMQEVPRRYGRIVWVGWTSRGVASTSHLLAHTADTTCDVCPQWKDGRYVRAHTACSFQIGRQNTRCDIDPAPERRCKSCSTHYERLEEALDAARWATIEVLHVDEGRSAAEASDGRMP